MVSSLMRLGAERYASADATLLLCIFMDQPGKNAHSSSQGISSQLVTHNNAGTSSQLVF